MNMPAKSLHVTLPEKLREFVELQTQKTGYSTKSDYIQQLVRQDMKRWEQIVMYSYNVFMMGFPIFGIGYGIYFIGSNY